MGTSTGIAWTDHTWNPWRGCTKISPGCANCYAEQLSARNPAVLGEWGPGSKRVLGTPGYLAQPYQWDAAAQRDGERRRVFCLSLGDWLEDRPDLDEPLAGLLGTIRSTPFLDWQLLTKRPENFHQRMAAALAVSPMLADWVHPWLLGHPPPNVWLGVSVESQEYAQHRIPHLMTLPARIRFLSCEPLLGPLRLDCFPWYDPSLPGCVAREVYPFCGMMAIPDCDWSTGRIHWVIVGGESGPRARPFDLCWASSLGDQIRKHNGRNPGEQVAYFVKQLGANPISTGQGSDSPLSPSPQTPLPSEAGSGIGPGPIHPSGLSRYGYSSSPTEIQLCGAVGNDRSCFFSTVV